MPTPRSIAALGLALALLPAPALAAPPSVAAARHSLVGHWTGKLEYRDATHWTLTETSDGTDDDRNDGGASFPMLDTTRVAFVLQGAAVAIGNPLESFSNALYCRATSQDARRTCGASLSL